MREDEQKLVMALRGGLRGRFQNSFHLLANAFEALDEQMRHSVTPTEYQTMAPLLVQIQTQLLTLRRLGEHAADAAVAPVLQKICTPRPLELLGQLREWCALFNELTLQEQNESTAQLTVCEGLQILLTMGDETLFSGLLTNLLSNSLASGSPVHITLACAPGLFCYSDDGPGLPEDAVALLTRGVWSDRLLGQGGLGLPLIRAYATAMGWALTVEKGAGLRIRFALPPCSMDMEELILESNGPTAYGRDQRMQYLRRELYPALPRKEEE